MRRFRCSRGVLLPAAGLAVLLAAGALPPVGNRPLVTAEGAAPPERGYVSSSVCRECHASQHESWRRTYHRTMSQAVTEETVLAPFAGETLSLGSQRYRLFRKDGGFWIDMPRPDLQNTTVGGRTVLNLSLPPETPRVARQVVQSTGSHHYQLYWYPSGRGRELYMLPFVWLKEDRRWAPRMAVFLAPPDNVEERLIWNFQCLPCHSTDGRPGYPEDPAKAGEGPDTRAAELGIACEACHGPGEAHAASAREVGSGSRPSPMVHPAKLPAQRSAQVCGQCHSVNLPLRPEDHFDWMIDGPDYRPGLDLDRFRFVLRAEKAKESPLYRAWEQQGMLSLEDLFWGDGQVRVTGREYNGLRDSKCFESGQLSCLNCHSMHSADPDDLLKPEAMGDSVCLSCHGQLRANITEHTHHAEGSPGSRCYNCHMPHTAYGLLKAERSHTITVPSAEESVKWGRPNACNACHLDRTVAWTADYLERWYGQKRVAIGGEHVRIAVGAVWLLTGDAGQRALAAWYTGWEPARQTAGEAWLAPLLAETLDDPYATVRYIAQRSLRRQAAYRDFEYDFVAAGPARATAVATARALAPQAKPNPLTLTTPAGTPDTAEIRRLLRKRDDRPVTLGE